MMRDLLDNDQVFNKIFHNNLKLWNRFVDDCVGVFMGSQKIFKKFFGKLKKQFRKYDLEITDEFSKESIIVLDIEIYKYKNHLVTKEHRKETSSCSYLKYGSAHPQHIYIRVLLRVKGSVYVDFVQETTISILLSRVSGTDVLTLVTMWLW